MIRPASVFSPAATRRLRYSPARPAASNGNPPLDTLPEAADSWSFFDAVYCISIEERLDRRAEAGRQFARVGLADRVEFVLVRKHPVNQEQGIYESHLLCLQKALAAGASHILIFEDDIAFRGFRAERLKAASAFLARQPDWTMFFLGALVSKSSPTGNRAVVEVRYRALTHAYAVNRPSAAAIVSTPWQGLPYDLYLRRLQPLAHALYPSFAFQSNASTDNQRPGLDRFRRLCGGLASIQRANERWQRHKRLAIFLHLIFLLGVTFLVWY